MVWKELLTGLKEFSAQATLRESEIRKQKASKKLGEQATKYNLFKQYDSRTKKVVKEFARNVGGKFINLGFVESKYWYGSSYRASQGDKIYANVSIWSPYGVAIWIPPAGEDLSLKCKQPFSPSALEEGYYYLIKEILRGETVTMHYYFIPFETFSEEKLATKLVEFYKEAVTHYLESLKAI